MNKRKISIIPLIVAGILLIINRIMLSGMFVPIPTDFKYLLYIVSKSFAILGFNLIPLSLGFYSDYFKDKKTISKISRYILVYLLVSVIPVITISILLNGANLKSFWSILFPISQGMYPYAVSMVVIFILLPLVFNNWNRLTKKQLIPVLYFSTFLIIIMPAVFGRDIWSLQAGGVILLNSYLVFLGYYFNRFNVAGNKNTFLKLIISLVAYAVMSRIMIYVSVATHFNYSTVNRFNVPYSIFAVVASVMLLKWLSKFEFKTKIAMNHVAIFLITTFIITSQSSSVRLIELLRNTHLEHVSDMQRFIFILEYTFVVIIIILILSAICLLIGKLSSIRNLIDKISFTSIDELFELEKKIKKYCVVNKKIFLVMLSFYLITLLQMLWIAFIIKNSNYPVSLVFWEHQPAMVLSMIILTMFFLLLLLLTNRFWYAYGLVFILNIIFTVSTILKIKLRSEPVLPADMSALTSIGDILNMISPVIVIISLIVMLFLIAITIILQLRYKRSFSIKLHLKRRLTYIALLVVGLGGLRFVNHENTVPGRTFELFRIRKFFYDQNRGAMLNSPLLQFINNIDVSVMAKPQGYSKEKIIKIMHKYDDEAEQINTYRSSWNKDQTMIFVLSESFSNPQRVPNLQLNKNPIPNISNYEKNNTSGLMMSAGYGGGTANMEWQALTGLNLSSLSPTLPTPYSQMVDKIKYNPNITNLFDQKIAVHPFNASLYNRKDVFKDFGFQKFYFDGSKNKLHYKNKIAASPYISDKSAYNDVLELISKNSNKSQFIQLSTMQNHMPYQLNDSKKSLSFSGSAIGNNKKAVNNYIQRIQYTDDDVSSFFKKLDKINRPITVVWYGDHLPGIYDGDSMTKYAVPLHQTDYIVYNNKKIRNSIKENNLVSTYSFSSLALKQAGIKVSPYYALLTKVTDEVPASITNPYTTRNNVFNGSQVFIEKDGTIKDYSVLTKQQKQIFDDYNLIQYDIVAGKQYSAKWAMQKVK